LSELIKWFERRKETKVISKMQRHLATTMSAVEDLERAVKATINNNEDEARGAVERVTKAEKEADRLRREVMSELAGGELPPTDREDMMHLMKRVDMVADWCRESTRILSVIPMKDFPDSLKKASVDMVEGVKECAAALRTSVSRMAEKPEEALKAADQVERLEEKVDDMFQNARGLLTKETKLRVGVAVMINELFETVESAADACEDACDHVRVIIVRR